jgi:hypothetical protein
MSIRSLVKTLDLTGPLLMLMLAALGCGTSASLAPPETRAGDWYASTSVGDFTLTVDSTGNSVTKFKYNFDCSGLSEHGTVTPSEGSDISTIENGQISLDLGAAGEPVVKAKFSRDGSTLSGTWEVIVGKTCSDKFEIRR